MKEEAALLLSASLTDRLDREGREASPPTERSKLSQSKQIYERFPNGINA